MLGGWHLMRPDETGPRAEAAAIRAIELDPSLAEPHATLGYLKTLWEWDWPGAEREFRRAIELNPEYGTAHHWFAFYWLTVGNSSASLAEIEKARSLSPLSPAINAEVAYFYSFARQYDRAEQEAAKAIELSPESPLTQRSLCRVYALQGKRDELEDAVEKSLRFSGRDSGNLLVAAAALGNIGEAQRGKQLLKEVFERFGENTIHAGWVALAYANLGDRDRAFAYYEKAMQDRSLVASWLRDPMLDGIRSDPRFNELFRRLGLEA
jgi:tetratricopeptide (TPR) repeat protein